MTEEEVLVELFRAMHRRTRAEEAIFAAVEAAADLGLSWDDIGHALGMDGRAAYSWVAPVVDASPPAPDEWFGPSVGPTRPRR